MVYIFKTSVTSSESVKDLKPLLDKIFEIHKWNFDLEDCDNILRIDSNKNISDKIIKILESHNFNCLELF